MSHAATVLATHHAAGPALPAKLMTAAVFAALMACLAGRSRQKRRRQAARTSHYQQQSADMARAIASGPGGLQRCRCGARYPAGATWCTNCRFWLPPTWKD